MDGNGRWAEQRGLPRIAGHRRGVETVKETVRRCRDLGITYLTLFAFSSENWQRPQEEVSALMGLLVRYLKSELKAMLKDDIRLHVIGETGRLPREVRQVLDETVSRTAGNQGMVLTLALSYGARGEMLRAVRCLAEEVRVGRMAPEEIDEAAFGRALDTRELPDPDLLIRTSGEMRISNFLLYQIAYAELHVTPVLWPDFSRKHLYEAIRSYQGRERRFGKTSTQVHPAQPVFLSK
jgi:undecaprenyl diphosphate synthase